MCCVHCVACCAWAWCVHLRAHLQSNHADYLVWRCCVQHTGGASGGSRTACWRRPPPALATPPWSARCRLLADGFGMDSFEQLAHAAGAVLRASSPAHSTSLLHTHLHRLQSDRGEGLESGVGMGLRPADLVLPTGEQRIPSGSQHAARACAGGIRAAHGAAQAVPPLLQGEKQRLSAGSRRWEGHLVSE